MISEIYLKISEFFFMEIYSSFSLSTNVPLKKTLVHPVLEWNRQGQKCCLSAVTLYRLLSHLTL